MNLEFDHLGIIVKSIEKELSIYKNLGYEACSDIFQDDNQKMRGIFLTPKSSAKITLGGGVNEGVNAEVNEAKVNIELIEDLSESRALSKMLNTSCGRVYHIAYKVNNLEENLENILSSLNARILSPIKPAVYYKKVCFLFLNNMQIIELVEYR